MRKMIFATGNENKMVEIREILGEDFDDHRIRLHLQMTVMYMDIVQMNK